MVGGGGFIIVETRQNRTVLSLSLSRDQGDLSLAKGRRGESVERKRESARVKVQACLGLPN